MRPPRLEPAYRSRIYGVDAARAIAIAGMVMVHFGPFEAPDTLAGGLYSVSAGRASVLFALLAGLSLSLLASSRTSPQLLATQLSYPGVTNSKPSPPSAARNRARIKLILRAVPLLPLGLHLQQLDHNALVILQYYSNSAKNDTAGEFSERIEKRAKYYINNVFPGPRTLQETIVGSPFGIRQQYQEYCNAGVELGSAEEPAEKSVRWIQGFGHMTRFKLKEIHGTEYLFRARSDHNM